MQNCNTNIGIICKHAQPPRLHSALTQFARGGKHKCVLGGLLYSNHHIATFNSSTAPLVAFPNEGIFSS